MGVPDEIRRKVETFQNKIESLKSANYNETQTRVEFIDPFFTALGWDVENKAGYAEAYKDVIHEFSLKTKDVIEAPDYCFRIGGTKKFFVEAKRPSVKLDVDISPAYQLRRYAWTAKLPLSILTDFEDFAVYDCRIPPNKNDKPSVSRVMFIQYTDYVDKWEEIESIFSREAVLKGSFDKYVESNKKKKGTAEVDQVFLKQMEEWRKTLAKNIALRNPSLNIHELNFAVQKTLDRIIFLRICEDRGIEDYGQLMTLQNGVNVYERLKQIFHRADEKYNSGLFHFELERGRNEPPDEITLNLAIDDKAIKDIIKELYYPESPYEFSVLPAEILGNVYEQFLGKVIRLTPSHHAVVEDKPEVKKAGGVYYTPTYIVDYIVKNTVGKILTPLVSSPLPKGRTKEGSTTPNEASKLRILDPACGSGSFLLGAYQYLLDWHLKYYLKEIESNDKLLKQKQPPIYMNDRGEYLLTTFEKKRILLNNIYGVDIDPQAVEVTKLSLMLKVLEGENTQTLSNALQFFRERALPDLSNNIKCGNSLIGPDFYDQPVSANPRFDGMEMQFLNDEEKLRINVFDWKKEFPQVFSTRHSERSEESLGFDVVIGNPPYGMRMIYTEEEKLYFKNLFNSAIGSYENYFLFFEASLKLLRNGGIHGFIVPVTWLTIPSANSLRKFILSGFAIKQIMWLPALVFKNAQVNTLVTIISKSLANETEIIIRNTLNITSNEYTRRIVKQEDFVNDEYKINIFIGYDERKILDKIVSRSIPLSSYANPCSGYNPYEVGKGSDLNGKPHTKETVKLKPYHSSRKIDRSWKPEIVGRDLSRYIVNVTGKRWVKYGEWLAAPRDPENFQGKRILVQEITGGDDKKIIAAYYEGELYYSRDVIPIKCRMEFPHPFFLLAIINSKLITWFHHKKNPKAQKALFPKILVSDLNNLPIIIVDENLTKQHDLIIRQVEKIIQLKIMLSTQKTPTEKTLTERQIELTDKQIDQLVYQLYGLTEEEIKIVEGNDSC